MCIQGSNVAFPRVIFFAHQKQQYRQLLSSLFAKPKSVQAISVRERGFTLVELMVALAVMALLITIGAPVLTNFLLQTEQDSALHQIKNIYSFARQEAVHRQVAVSICPLSQRQPDQCSENWSCGMLVYIDLNGDSTFNQAADTKLRELYFSEGVAIKLGTKKLITQLKLKPEGTVSANSFTVSVPGLDINRKLTFSNVGRARFAEVEVSKDKGLTTTKCPP